MSVIVKPLTGTRRDEPGVEIDTGIDEILIDSKVNPVPKRVGTVGRFQDASICLTRGVSESELAEIKKVVAARHGGLSERKVATAPPIAKGDK